VALLTKLKYDRNKFRAFTGLNMLRKCCKIMKRTEEEEHNEGLNLRALRYVYESGGVVKALGYKPKGRGIETR
jgi:hypothetical protein